MCASFRDSCVFGEAFWATPWGGTQVTRVSHQHLPSIHSQEMKASVLKGWSGQHIAATTTQRIESNLGIFKLPSSIHITHKHTQRTKSTMTRNQTRKTFSFRGIAFSFIYVYIAFLKEENKDKGHDSCISMDWSDSVNWIP